MRERTHLLTGAAAALALAPWLRRLSVPLWLGASFTDVDLYAYYVVRHRDVILVEQDAVRVAADGQVLNRLRPLCVVLHRDGRIVEWVERTGSVVRYRSEEARRALLLTIKRVQEVQPFDASIWGPF